VAEEEDGDGEAEPEVALTSALEKLEAGAPAAQAAVRPLPAVLQKHLARELRRRRSETLSVSHLVGEALVSAAKGIHSSQGRQRILYYRLAVDIYI